MLKLINDENEEIKIRFPGGCCYKFYENDKNIGFAVINEDEEDKVYIYIKKELRGNGHGKLLFSELMGELEKKEYKDIKVKFDRDNIQMLKIVKHFGGLHLSTDNGLVKYLIPIKK